MKMAIVERRWSMTFKGYESVEVGCFATASLFKSGKQNAAN